MRPQISFRTARDAFHTEKVFSCDGHRILIGVAQWRVKYTVTGRDGHRGE
jgi:hypothetical protein